MFCFGIDEIDDFVSSSYGAPIGVNETAEDRFNFFKITKTVGSYSKSNGGTPEAWTQK